MADDEWDSENFEVKSPLPIVPVVTSKWEGEDEDDDVRDNWEDDDEEDKSDKSNHKEQTIENKVVEVQKKTKIAQKIAEREKREQEEEEKLRSLKEVSIESTTEDILNEKIRQKLLQEEADLHLAKETFGISENRNGIDALEPTSKDEFDVLRKAISNKVEKYEANDLYGDFVEDLIRDLCILLPSARLRKVKMTLESLQSEKSKSEKSKKPGVGKGKLKAKLTIENKTLVSYDEDYNEYEDFM